MKPWQERSLHDKIYLSDDRVYLEAVRLIGYQGTTPMAFYDAAKKLKNWSQYKFESAVRDLTDFKKREPPILRLELTPKARKLARVILGCPPEDPEFELWWTARLLSKPDAVPPVSLDPPQKPKKAPRTRARKAKAGG
jgi:hypothetical protein